MYLQATVVASTIQEAVNPTVAEAQVVAKEAEATTGSKVVVAARATGRPATDPLTA